MKKKTAKASTRENNASKSVSSLEVFFLHLICGLGLAVTFWVSKNVHSFDFESDPSHTLCLVWMIQSPIAILLYSRYRLNPEHNSYWKAVGRGILAIPAGALVNALGALALGAPVGIQYFSKTVYWSLLMSVFTFVPAASVYGSSWTDWQRIFAHTKPVGSIDCVICLPAHGAVIGAWFGAWPMPLDWEKPWQEWPVSVSYGALAGYLIAMLASSVLVLVKSGGQHVKGA